MRFKIYGQHDDKTIRQMETCMSTGSAAAGVLCADGHLGYAHPIGGVVGYTDHISISGVGFDIACGNMAIRLDTPYQAIAPRITTILQDISRVISFGIGRKNDERVEHELFERDDLWRAADVRDLKPMAQAQLGTVGSGNHYVDILEGDDGLTWIGVHFGSRGLGHKITTKYLKQANAKDGMEVPSALLPSQSDAGRGYLAGLELGGLYAYAGREWVVERVRRIIGGKATFSVHNHHNWAWRETHNDVDMWVVRKGATPAFPGQYGFVGGSMGDDAVILRGVDSEQSRKFSIRRFMVLAASCREPKPKAAWYATRRPARRSALKVRSATMNGKHGSGTRASPFSVETWMKRPRPTDAYRKSLPLMLGQSRSSTL